MLSNKDLISKFEQIVVQIQTQFSTGSGFYLTEYDVIVTNYHVINGSDEILIQRSNNSKLKAEILYLDPSMDVAFLRPEFPLKETENVLLKSPSHLNNGDKVTAIGHPHGLKFTTTQGIVSKVNRLFSGLRYVQTDAAINPGNSGGPLIDSEGHIIGINTFIISESNNLGFALHIDQIFDHLAMLKTVTGSIFLCPSCSNELKIMGKFCPFCGDELPDNLPVHVEGMDHKPPETILEEALTEKGVNAVHARRGHNFWQYEYGSAFFSIFFNEDGTILALCRVAKLPKAMIAELYEFLLRENSKLSTPLRFGTNQKHITLSFLMNAVSLNDDHFRETVHALMDHADSYDDILFDKFQCEKPDNDEMDE
jgi:serine protease Do